MPAQTLFAPGVFSRNGLRQQFVVAGEFGAADGRMPEMKAQRPAAHVEPANPRIHQADGQLGILAPPAGKRFVVTIHVDKVVTPDGQIAAADAPQMILERANGKWPAKGILQAGNLILKNGAAAVGGEIIFAEPRGGFFPDQRAVALNELRFDRKRSVICNETRVWNGVAIEKNQAIAARRRNRQVQNARAPEALMFLPDVFAAE